MGVEAGLWLLSLAAGAVDVGAFPQEFIRTRLVKVSSDPKIVAVFMDLIENSFVILMCASVEVL